MVYNGQNDLIVETPGTFKWAERVHYDQAEEFRYNYLLFSLGILCFILGMLMGKLRAIGNRLACLSLGRLIMRGI